MCMGEDVQRDCEHDFQRTQGTNFWFIKEKCTKCGLQKWTDKKLQAMEAGIYPETCPHEDVRYIAKIKGKDQYRYYCSACYSVVDIRTGDEARSSKDISTKMEMASKKGAGGFESGKRRKSSIVDVM